MSSRLVVSMVDAASLCQRAYYEGDLCENSRGKRVFVVAGTRCVSDILTDAAAVIAGTIRGTSRYEREKERLEKEMSVDGGDPIVLAGHSLGGAVVLELAREFKLPGVVFNPLWPRETVVPDNVEVYSAEGDPVSAKARMLPSTHIITHPTAFAHFISNFI